MDAPEEILDKNQYDIITKLKFLSKMQVGDKINVDELKLERNGFILGMKRRLWTIDNRQNGERFVRGVIEGGLEEMKRLTQKSGGKREEVIGRGLLIEMRGALKGVRTLKGTYSEDTYYCCGIDTYIELIEACMLEYDNEELTVGEK